jgi:AbrB family looped-hinge helix DNA binding protein
MEGNMDKLEVTKLSSKGQVVLPQSIRRKLRLEEGEKFIVLAERDTVILKKLERPAREQAKKLIKASQAWAKKVGLTQADLNRVIRDVRKAS